MNKELTPAMTEALARIRRTRYANVHAQTGNALERRGLVTIRRTVHNGRELIWKREYLIN